MLAFRYAPRPGSRRSPAPSRRYASSVAYQVVAPLISAAFEISGGLSGIGQVATRAGAKNALLAAGLVVFTTVIDTVMAPVTNSPPRTWPAQTHPVSQRA